MDPTAAARLRLLSRPGCHLCDDAREVVRAVVGEGFAEVDITSDPLLLARFGEEIPVLLVDGEQLCYGRVEPGQLRAALGLPGGRRPRWWRPAP